MDDDPMKELARAYDDAVVAKGGKSIFGPQIFRNPYLGTPALDGKSAPTRAVKNGKGTRWLGRGDLSKRGVSRWYIPSDFDEWS